MDLALNELLGTIWEKHARIIRQELREETGRTAVRFAASNVDVNSGSALDVQWGLQWKYLERLVREAVKELESRLEPGEGTARFLAQQAVVAASALVRKEVERLPLPSLLAGQTKERWEQHKERLALHLETVAETELRVIASTPRLRRPLTVAGALAPGTKIVFPDTNVLLRGQPLKQIDWKAVLGADQVELVIARVVVDEVDKKKYDPKQSMQERARKANAQLQEIQEAEGRVREGVRLALTFAELDSNELRSHGLLWDHGDDRLLGSALTHRGGDKTDIVIVSMDNGLLNRAASLGFKTMRLPEKYRVPTPPDPLEAENRRLLAEIDQLKASYPKLNFVFSTGNTEMTAEIPIQAPNDIALPYVREWSQARGRVIGASPIIGDPVNVGEASEATADETAAFWDFAQKQEAAEHAVARCIGVRFRLNNDSAQPAEAVRVFIELPPEVESFNPRIDFPEEPRFRSSPVAGQPSIVAQMPKFRNRPIRFAPPDPTSTPGVSGALQTDDPRVLAFQIQGVVQDRGRTTLPEVLLLFKAGELPGQVQLGYKIIASGVPQEFVGALKIRIVRTQPPSPAVVS